MTRLGVLLGVLGLFALGLYPPAQASTLGSPQSLTGTPLPPGWELCVLEGIQAPVTRDNVSNLDEWQVAEGGSTNNSAAYDPFNTRRVTDVDNMPLPHIVSSNGFPAFSTWPSGCAATVATLLQPNMAPAVQALDAGDVSPPAQFLFIVDTTQWCAPSAGGTPCYTSQIRSGETDPTSSSDEGSGAVAILTDTSSAVEAYDNDVSETAIDAESLASETQQLALAEQQESAAEEEVTAAALELRRLALYEYMTDKEVARLTTQFLKPFAVPSERDILTQYYEDVDVSDAIGYYEQARVRHRATVANRLAHQETVVRSTSMLDQAVAAENQAMSLVQAEVTTLEAAGACTSGTATTPTQLPLSSGGVVQIGVLKWCLALLIPSR